MVTCVYFFIYSYVAVGTFCAVRCLTIISSSLLFSNYLFDVISTVHHSIELFHQTTLMHNFLYSLTICTVQMFTESKDTRCCVNTIIPPEDGHVNARNMSRIIV